MLICDPHNERAQGDHIKSVGLHLLRWGFYVLALYSGHWPMIVLAQPQRGKEDFSNLPSTRAQAESIQIPGAVRPNLASRSVASQRSSVFLEVSVDRSGSTSSDNFQSAISKSNRKTSRRIWVPAIAPSDCLPGVNLDLRGEYECRTDQRRDSEAKSGRENRNLQMDRSRNSE